MVQLFHFAGAFLLYPTVALGEPPVLPFLCTLDHVPVRWLLVVLSTAHIAVHVTAVDRIPGTFSILL